MASNGRSSDVSPTASPARKQQRRNEDGDDDMELPPATMHDMQAILEGFRDGHSNVQEQLQQVVGAVATLSATVDSNEKKLRNDMAGLVGAVDTRCQR